MAELTAALTRHGKRTGVEISTHRGDNWTMTRRSAGMTLVEIVIVLAIIGILSAVSARLYDNYLHRVAVAQAKTDILAITVEITRYQWANNEELPDGLDAIGKAGLLDPWGNPYQYLNMTGVKGQGKFRKNKNLVPINSDYDLYSKGPDGESQGPLTAKASRDDIVRANNGRFIGVASDY